MSLLTKEKGEKTQKINIKPFLLPVYIIASGIFILYVAYSSLQNVVYVGGLTTGQNQGYTAGQNQAVQSIVTQANAGCDVLTLTAGDQTTAQLVNTKCLAAPEAQVGEEVSQ